MNTPDKNDTADCRHECDDDLDCGARRNRKKDALILFLLLTTILLLFYLPRMIVLVRAGEAGVKFKKFEGGTVTDYVYGEGLHVLFPWDKMTVYNVRFQSTNVNFTILAESGLTLRMELTIRYRPTYDLLGVLHQRLGPNYVQTVIIPEVKSAIRTTVGDYTAEEIYTTQRAILEKVVGTAVEESAQRFIQIDDVIIERIILPERIQTAIEAKLTEKEVLGSYEYRLKWEALEKERKMVEAEGFAEANRLLAESITPTILTWRGIEATKMISTSTNSKVVIIGNRSQDMPVILGNQ